MQKNPSTEDCGCGPHQINPSRRRFLQQALAGAAGFIVLGTAEACTPPDPEMLVGSLKELDEQGHLSPKFNNHRLFCTRLGEELVIFSLTCRHKRCTVKWKEGKQEFQCPCHDGRYNANGDVLSGPPPEPLFRFKHEIRGQEIWVLNEEA